MNQPTVYDAKGTTLEERVADEVAKLRKAADEQFTWWKRVSR